MASGIVDLELEAYSVSFFNANIYTIVTCSPTTISQWAHDVAALSASTSSRALLTPTTTANLSASSNFASATTALSTNSSTRSTSLLPHRFFIANKNYTFVGVDIYSELRKLGKDYPFQPPTNAMLDLRNMETVECQGCDLKNVELEDLVRVVLGKEMDKPEEMRSSMWDIRHLMRDQVKYACIDAYVSLEISRVLNAANNRVLLYILKKYSRNGLLPTYVYYY